MRFQYLMKLHYSQTLAHVNGLEKLVSVPYEITLLSNMCYILHSNGTVSVPYEITLLSNTLTISNQSLTVSVPYEITLLSNNLLITA